jgi:hypothetical protein
MTVLYQAPANKSLQRTTPAPCSGIAACNRLAWLDVRQGQIGYHGLCRAAQASGKPSIRLGVAVELQRSIAGKYWST